METPIGNRSNNFVALFQVEGLRAAIRLLISRGAKPGKTAWEMLSRLRNMFVERGSGATIELIPEVTGQMSTEDLLIVAEVLRSSMETFLTPEEIQEKKSIFGFHSENEA